MFNRAHFVVGLGCCDFMLPCFYARIQEGKHSQEIAQFQEKLEEARTQLQLLQKQLDEQLSKQPIGNQEVTCLGGFAFPLSGTDRTRLC